MSWKKVKLGDILRESKIESIQTDPNKRITVRLNFKGVEKRPFEKGVEGGTKYYVRKAGQFIYGKQNLFKGAFGLVPKELGGFESSLDIPTFDIHKSCSPEWLIYFLRQGEFYKNLESLATGTGSRRIQPARLFEVEIPLPSLCNQLEIIIKVHQFQKRYYTLDAELDQQQTYLQLLRQTILQEAVQGKLTKQDPTDEPATELLKRIKAEKEKLIKTGKLKNEKKLPPIKQHEISFELPEGWIWCRLGELSTLITSGSRNWKNFYSSEGALFIRSQNIKAGELSLKDKAYVVLPKKAEGTRTAVRFGDILLTITGGNVGYSAVLDRKDIGEAYVSQHVALIRLFRDDIIKRISFVIRAENSKGGQIRKYVYGDKPGLSLTQIQNLIIAFPPLSEQHRIVVKVQRLQQQLNQFEAQIQQSRQYSQQLLQTILKEAFERKSKVSAIEKEEIGIPSE